MLAKVFSLLGFAVSHTPGKDEIAKAMRHARAAGWQHQILASRAQTASLDRTEAHIADQRGAEGLVRAHSLRDTIGGMLRRLDDVD